jgi:hypothetical protein
MALASRILHTLRLSPFRAVLSTGGLGIPACQKTRLAAAGFASCAFCLLSPTKLCRLDQWQILRLSSDDPDGGE